MSEDLPAAQQPAAEPAPAVEESATLAEWFSQHLTAHAFAHCDDEDFATALLASDWMAAHDRSVATAALAPVEALDEKWDDYALDPDSVEEDMRDALRAALALGRDTAKQRQ